MAVLRICKDEEGFKFKLIQKPEDKPHYGYPNPYYKHHVFRVKSPKEVSYMHKGKKKTISLEEMREILQRFYDGDCIEIHGRPIYTRAGMRAKGIYSPKEGIHITFRREDLSQEIIIKAGFL